MPFYMHATQQGTKSVPEVLAHIRATTVMKARQEATAGFRPLPSSAGPSRRPKPGHRSAQQAATGLPVCVQSFYLSIIFTDHPLPVQVSRSSKQNGERFHLELPLPLLSGSCTME